MALKALMILVLYIVGIVVGYSIVLDQWIIDVIDNVVSILLAILIFLVGMSIAVNISYLKNVREYPHKVVALVFSTVAGSLLGGLASCLLTGFECIVGVAVSLGMGWYSFTGSYLALYNPLYGLIGFSTNLFREIMMFTLYPILYKRYSVEGISIGGATTMDTALPIILYYSGREKAFIAFIHGFILTLLIPLIIPYVMLFK